MNFESVILFEQIVKKIFSEAEYIVTFNNNIDSVGDFIAEKDSEKLCVEIKYSKINEKTINRICSVPLPNDVKLILVTAYKIEEERKNHYKKEYTKLELIDISNLLFAVQYRSELRNELIASLPYSVDGIEPKEGFIKINNLKHDDYTDSLIKEMALCKAGKPMAREYEVICHKLLENIFSEDLALWNEQQKSNNELYKFDLLCRIKDGNQKTFWSIIERFFNSKYVIFEFKNYNNPITQKEIYTTEKYLYSKALRSVGILIAANGYTENAYWAAKGCLRENGKLIILLETSDLIEMNKMKNDLEDPSNYLLNKLDKLLLELEK